MNKESKQHKNSEQQKTTQKSGANAANQKPERGQDAAQKSARGGSGGGVHQKNSMSKENRE